jgi:small subunit ribosomal protein S18
MQKKTTQEKRQCFFCMNNIHEIDFKDVQLLRRFVSSYMKITPRRRNGLCMFHQRKVARAIKQARNAGLMAIVPK